MVSEAARHLILQSFNLQTRVDARRVSVGLAQLEAVDRQVLRVLVVVLVAPVAAPAVVEDVVEDVEGTRYPSLFCIF